MRLMIIYTALSSILLCGSCGEQSGFSGGGSSKKKPPPPTASVVPASKPQTSNIEPAGPQPTPTPLQPEQVVDGQEVFGNCGQCLNRAQQLAQGIGFLADMGRTINMGFYKIDPSRNLCDIHFMANLNLPIDDHNNVDTIGNNQIILYCPCNCGWAQDGGGGGPGPGFPPLF